MDKTLSTDLISREAAVREALDMYHALAARRDACQRAKDAGGTVMWTGAAEIAQAMVRRLMELPESDAVQVVRCEKCLYACKIDEQPHIRVCANTGVLVSLDYFCSHGRCLGGEDDA